MSGRILSCALVCAFSHVYGQVYSTSLPIDHPAIHYNQGPFDDPVAHLAKRIERGEQHLDFRDGALGYLPSLLEHLGINADSQALVFSKTSFQAPKISPKNPRAIYFSDDAAVGWVRGGTGFEIAAVDPKQGIEFYTLATAKSEKPRFERRDVCLKCHQGAATEGVPGIFIGSVYPNALGQPEEQGAIITDHRTPFEDRWGGWYVTAKRGEQRDRANGVALDPAEPETLDSVQNLPSLIHRFDPAGYLAPVSDIVALMTFEHQTQAINLMTRLQWLARMGDAREIDAAVEALADYMLFAGEARLVDPIEGVSAFTETFPRRGPRDQQGRSLRDFDLQTRLFRYPLSYTIYSPQFDALPEPVRASLYRRLFDTLTSAGIDPKFASLSKSDRRTIVEIVHETKPNLPAYWR